MTDFTVIDDRSNLQQRLAISERKGTKMASNTNPKVISDKALPPSGGRRAVVGRKSGPLGRKGQETRRTLMEAARRLLDTHSPMSLTALAISAEAGTSSATFYVYFDNVEDVLWALCDSISEDTSKLFPSPDFLRVESRLEEDAWALIKGYSEIWSRHGPLLLYRNMEADRGNKRFNQLVLRIALPFLEQLTDRIVDMAPPERAVTRSEANAEAVVLIGAIDRIAAALRLYPEDSLTPEVLLRAETRVLVRMLHR